MGVLMSVSRELGLPLKINRELGFGPYELTGIWCLSVIVCQGLSKMRLGLAKMG